MKFIVDENKWLRGIGEIDSRLLDKQGKMCCLGFVALQSGYSESDIKDVSCPADMENSEKFPEWLAYFNDYYSVNTLKAEELMSINDNCSISDSERKNRIQEIFAQNGDEIIFVNEG